MTMGCLLGCCFPILGSLLPPFRHYKVLVYAVSSWGPRAVALRSLRRIWCQHDVAIQDG